MITVSELLAQKRQLRTERDEAPEPEFVLTEREFDHLLRKAFADRERSLQAMIDKAVERRVIEFEAKIAEHAATIAVELAEIRTLGDARLKAVAEFVAGVRKELRAEIVVAVGELRTDVTVERAHAADRAAEVIELPPIQLRSPRHG